MVTKFLCTLYNVIINHINEIIIIPHLYCPTAIDDFESASAFTMASFACNSETSFLTNLISSRRVDTLAGRSSALTWQKTRNSHAKEELFHSSKIAQGVENHLPFITHSTVKARTTYPIHQVWTMKYVWGIIILHCHNTVKAMTYLPKTSGESYKETLHSCISYEVMTIVAMLGFSLNSSYGYLSIHPTFLGKI